MRTTALSPLFRQSVGFDRFHDLFERSLLEGRSNVSNYPPYNIEKTGDEKYIITLAVAGFSEDDITIISQENTLTISGKIDAKDQRKDKQYLHQGIAARAFETRFSLADHVKVHSADLQNGLLKIYLLREVPEKAKAKMVGINSNQATNNGNNTKIAASLAEKDVN